MIALYWTIGILAVLVLIGFIRISIRLCLDDDIRLTLHVLGLTFRLYPKRQAVRLGRYSYRKMQKWRSRQQEKKDKAEAKAERKADRSGKAKEPGERFLAKLRNYQDLVKTFFRSFSKHFRIRIAKFHIRVGSDDAAKTALLYGAVAQAVSYIAGAVERFTNLRLKRGSEILVEADFVGDSIKADLILDLSLRVWHLLAILLRAALAFFKQQIRKAVKETAPSKKQSTSRAAARTEPAAAEHS